MHPYFLIRVCGGHLSITDLLVKKHLIHSFSEPPCSKVHSGQQLIEPINGSALLSLSQPLASIFPHHLDFALYSNGGAPFKK